LWRMFGVGILEFWPEMFQERSSASSRLGVARCSWWTTDRPTNRPTEGSWHASFSRDHYKNIKLSNILLARGCCKHAGRFQGHNDSFVVLRVMLAGRPGGRGGRYRLSNPIGCAVAPGPARRSWHSLAVSSLGGAAFCASRGVTE